MNDTNRAELLPCPFCGGQASFDHDDAGANWIDCAQCGASTNQRYSLMDDCTPILAEQWNRRAQPINDTIASQLDSVTTDKIRTLAAQGMKPVGVVMLADDGKRATIDMGRVTWTGQNAEDSSEVEPTIEDLLWYGLPPVERVALSDAVPEPFRVLFDAIDSNDTISAMGIRSVYAAEMDQARAILSAQAIVPKRNRLPLSDEDNAAFHKAAENRDQAVELPSGALMFINYGEGPQDYSDLDCPHCGGSGHKGDIGDTQSTDAENVSKNESEINRAKWLQDVIAYLEGGLESQIMHESEGSIEARRLLAAIPPLTKPLIAEAARTAPTGWDAEFLSKRLGRVANLVGIPMPDMTHDQIAECAGTILGQIASKLDAAVKRDDVAGDAKDTARLNWLDEVNAKTNARYGTTYGWRFDLNHNRAALTDHNTPALPVREAIDAAIAARTKEAQ